MLIINNQVQKLEEWRSEEDADRLYEQWKRLKGYRLHPMEEAYSTMKNRLDWLEEIREHILKNSTMCLTSNCKYTRRLAFHFLGNNNG
jgi:hypothetical protein